MDGKRKGITKKVRPAETDEPQDSEGSRKAITYVFKSKYREDKVLLEHGSKVEHKDGSKTIKSDVWAEFQRNTWSTKDPRLAGILRNQIEEWEDIAPLHIMETTNV